MPAPKVSPPRLFRLAEYTPCAQPHSEKINTTVAISSFRLPRMNPPVTSHLSAPRISRFACIGDGPERLNSSLPSMQLGRDSLAAVTRFAAGSLREPLKELSVQMRQ